MRVGVTGSSGFIGGALVEALRARGDDVIRFVRPGSTESAEGIVRWDPSRQLIDEGDLRRVGGFDAVVNLAGAGIADKRWTVERKREILESRTNSTSLLVGALATGAAQTGILASGSAIGYYGSRGNEILDETSSCGTDFLAGVCVGWERAALGLETAGAKVALLRTGIVMSRHGGALKKQLPLFRFGLGGSLASGRQWLSPISLRDEIQAILWVLDHEITGPVNLVGPAPLKNVDFTKALAGALHRPALLRVPGFALQMVLGPELATGAVLASQRVIPHVLEESGYRFHDSSPDAIIAAALYE